MNLNELRDRAYKTACEHGWHDEELSNEHFLCLVISELMEAVQADRKGKHADVVMFKICQDDNVPLTEGTIRIFKEVFEKYIKDTVEDELCDACIRMLDYLGTFNIQLDDSCSGPEVIEEFSRIYNDKTFTESIFNITIAVTRFGIQIAFLKIFGLAKHLGIDLIWHIEQKQRYNELRAYKHGKKY